MTPLVNDFIALGMGAVLLICAIVLDRLLRRLFTRALVSGHGENSSLLPPPAAGPNAD
jgi:hypothetical protein